MKARLRFIIVLSILFQLKSLFGQDGFEINLACFQGIQQDEFTFLDLEGYSILVYEENKEFSEKTIKKLMKKFKISKSNIGKRSKQIKEENLVFEKYSKDDEVTIFNKKIIYKLDKEYTRLVEFSTIIERDTVIENEILKIIINNKIPKNTFNNWEVDSIRFVNRYIKLGNACQWQNVGNIQCPYNGQMDWSIFSNETRARNYLKKRIKLTSNQKMSAFISKDSINVLFENQELMAQKNILKIKAPKFMLGGSNELYIYYVFAEIDNLYIACTMSHYSNDKNAPNLPPLISEVMKINER